MTYPSRIKSYEKKEISCCLKPEYINFRKSFRTYFVFLNNISLSRLSEFVKCSPQLREKSVKNSHSLLSFCACCDRDHHIVAFIFCDCENDDGGHSLRTNPQPTTTCCRITSASLAILKYTSWFLNETALCIIYRLVRMG